MASPVVALRRGSVPEVVDHGRTGFIVDEPDQLPAAIERARSLQRQDCRTHVEDHFGLAQMVSGYEQVYLGLGRVARTPAHGAVM